jgi:GNAT superfamily N-acetyltransferase
MKTLSIDVRRAEPQDARAISEVHRHAWLQAYSGLIPHKPLVQMLERRGETWWRKATQGPATLLVLDVAGVIAGYATIGLNRAKALPYEGEIYEIYLRPEYQGIGMGARLFNESRRLLKFLGCEGFVCWCLEDSEHAASFFGRNGGLDIAEGMEDFAGTQLRKVGFVWR